MFKEDISEANLFLTITEIVVGGGGGVQVKGSVLYLEGSVLEKDDSPKKAESLVVVVVEWTRGQYWQYLSNSSSSFSIIVSVASLLHLMTLTNTSTHINNLAHFPVLPSTICFSNNRQKDLSIF